MERPGTGIWVAWGVALAGGIAVLAALLLLGRMDLAVTCGAASVCRRALPPVLTVLAFGGTAAAITGGLVATVLTVRRTARDGAADAQGWPER